MNSLTFRRYGLIEYRQAHHLQTALVRRRIDGEIGDTLLLLEHPPTITIGRFGRLENIVASREQLEVEGISLVFSDRGGDVTYHGPGQLVGYPIIDLRQHGKDVHRYIHDLEEVLIRVLGSFGISASRDLSHPGVWVESEEVAAIGLKIKRWVSMHGFALNVRPNLEHFSLINPCGFADRRATSISRLLGHGVPMEVVIERLLSSFSEVFDIRLERSDISVGEVRISTSPLGGLLEVCKRS